MANQIRSGGTQKITTPISTDFGVRNADRVIENIYNLTINERLFEDGSIPADKIVGGVPIPPEAGLLPGANYMYAARWTQSGTNTPVEDIVYVNDLNLAFGPGVRDGAGSYEIQLDNYTWGTQSYVVVIPQTFVRVVYNVDLGSGRIDLGVYQSGAFTLRDDSTFIILAALVNPVAV